MYRAIWEALKNTPMKRGKLNAYLGVSKESGLQYYLYQLDKHGYIERIDGRYHLATDKPLYCPCSRCGQMVLSWQLDAKARGKCCHPKRYLRIVKKAFPPKRYHALPSRVLQCPFSQQSIAVLFPNKEFTNKELA
ncbi:hypothetical protein [Thaumasiovibrio sp. DFM-14]|uniref:hypothetical protein n=1 Tax=Thaumasiovibrio sp. DFM-14 TaxID=3384792 RepID=UPI0039A23B53